MDGRTDGQMLLFVVLRAHFVAAFGAARALVVLKTSITSQSIEYMISGHAFTNKSFKTALQNHKRSNLGDNLMVLG